MSDNCIDIFFLWRFLGAIIYARRHIVLQNERKVDAPSGTAYMIAEAIKTALNTDKTFTYGRHGTSAKREDQEIGIHAVRGGTIIGEHSAIFAGIDEVIEIKHTAASRRVFGIGALKAAAFLVAQENGFYTMGEMLGSA